MGESGRDYLREAQFIVARETRMVPERRHLEALVYVIDNLSRRLDEKDRELKDLRAQLTKIREISKEGENENVELVCRSERESD